MNLQFTVYWWNPRAMFPKARSGVTIKCTSRQAHFGALEYEIAKAEIIGTRTISRRFGEKFRSIHCSYAPKDKGW